ncbi:ATP-binding protein [Cognatazoarcus halotolerans]|uniref:ATP-binding protein n=1 Tax=Cognatazoarcus halotolerans TaxID=2686016 RepID=UPI00135CE935|nr:ATP-binding protein [Cognatazoarcus halotolerans]MCB1901770.1 response regulator [Rhodocyclaceae bacterium]MCP5308237.1 response regulator [Zoogloeaceae bacterium]MCP5360919.1 response regulator [Nevskiaceae bacterium]
MTSTNAQTDDAHPDPAESGAAPLARALSLVLLACATIIVLATVYHANRLRTENLANHRIVAEGLARIGEHEITRTLQAVEHLLDARLDDWRAADGADGAAFSALLSKDLAGLPAVRSLSIVSAAGHIEADSSADAIGTRLAPTAIDEISPPATGSAIAFSRPWRGRDLSSGEPVANGLDVGRSAYFFTMGLEGQLHDGHAIGVATINPDFFSGFLSSIVGSPEYVVELYRYDGTLLLSTRPHEHMPGSSAATQKVFRRLLPDKEIGVIEDQDGEDPRILAYRASRRYPLVIEVEVPHREALAGWRSEVHNLVIAAGLSLLLIGLIAVLLRRYNQRRHVEQERARQANELAARVFESSYDGIFITDPAQDIIRINNAFSSITGYTEAEVLGKSPCMLVTEADQEMFCDAVREEIATNGEWRGELTARRKDGSRYCSRFAIGTVRDRRGMVSNYIGTFIDVSETKEHEAALREAKEVAEAANLAKSQFLATMSHELRTPMNAILGMAQLQLMEGNSEAENQAYARTILDAGTTLLTLLNDILDLAKVEAGGLELVDGVIDPERILSEVGNLFSHSAHEKGVAFRQHWAGPSQRRYRGDAIRLRQILSNLISNAIKFTDEGSISISGGERSLPSGEPGLYFEVIDTGIGISHAHQAALFKPFSQVDASATRRFGGTGLGLSIVRKLAELMGGEAGVDSREAEGSRFWFTIGAVALKDTAESGASDAPTGLPAGSEYPILVVEDDAVNRSLLEQMLKKIGYPVISAANGAEALEQLETAEPPPSLVLMDCHMPVMDGLQATRRVRQREQAEGRPRIPVIAVTAEVFERNRACCIEAGMDDFIEKPITLQILRETLERHTRQTGRHRKTA